MRRHALSRSASLTSSTCMNRAIAFRTCLASIKGSFRSEAKANDESGRRSFCAALNVEDFVVARVAVVAFLVLLFAAFFLVVGTSPSCTWSVPRYRTRYFSEAQVSRGAAMPQYSVHRRQAQRGAHAIDRGPVLPLGRFK